MRAQKTYKIEEIFLNKENPDFSEWYKTKITNLAYLFLKKYLLEEEKNLTDQNMLIYTNTNE
jgi:hypothetical protein